MSTYLHLVCLDHDPPLVAEEESGQHLYDLPQIRADIAAREELVASASMWENWKTVDEYFRRNTANFLVQHQKCRIGIQSEYGVDYPITEYPEETRA